MGLGIGKWGTIHGWTRSTVAVNEHLIRPSRVQKMVSSNMICLQDLKGRIRWFDQRQRERERERASERESGTCSRRRGGRWEGGE